MEALVTLPPHRKRESPSTRSQTQAAGLTETDGNPDDAPGSQSEHERSLSTAMRLQRSLTRLTRLSTLRPGRLAVALALGLLLIAGSAAPAPAAMADSGATKALVCQRSAITGKCWCRFSYGWRPAPSALCSAARP